MRGDGDVSGGRGSGFYTSTVLHTLAYTHITHSYTPSSETEDWEEGRLETEFPSPEYDLCRWCGEAGDRRGGGAIAAWVGPLLF